MRDRGGWDSINWDDDDTGSAAPAPRDGDPDENDWASLPRARPSLSAKVTTAVVFFALMLVSLVLCCQVAGQIGQLLRVPLPQP